MSVRTKLGQTGVPFVRVELSIEQDNRTVAFALLFEESLLSFLPGDAAAFSNLFVSFASTAVDNFLFLQFAETSLQIRTLLVSREDDISRVFREKSFYSVPLPFPQSWIQTLNFQITVIGGQTSSAPNLLSETSSSVDTPLLVTFTNQQKNIKYEKDNYHSFEINLEQKTFDIFFHKSNYDRIIALKDQNYLRSTKNDNNSYSVQSPAGNAENIQLKEIIINFDEIPRTILTCSSFLVEKSNLGFLRDNGFSIETLPAPPPPQQTSTSNLNHVVSSTLASAATSSQAIPCPFPSCGQRVLPASPQYAAIAHFLTHPDFKRVVEGQVRRHQDKKAVPQVTADFYHQDIMLRTPHG